MKIMTIMCTFFLGVSAGLFIAFSVVLYNQDESLQMAPPEERTCVHKVMKRMGAHYAEKLGHGKWYIGGHVFDCTNGGKKTT